MTSPLLPLLASAALVAASDMKGWECQDAGNSSKDDPSVYDIDLQSPSSLRLIPRIGDEWEMNFYLGKVVNNTFVSYFHMELKRPDKRRSLFQYKLFRNQSKALLLNHRLQSSWVQGGRQLGLQLGQSKTSLVFMKNDEELLLQLAAPQLEGLDAVKIALDTAVEECVKPAATTTTSSTTSTTTTRSTTSTTIPTTTTLTTTNNPPEERLSTVSLVSGVGTSLTTVIVDQESTFPPETNGTGVAKPVVGVHKCHYIPVWAWACAGLAAAFFLFLLIIMAYTLTLYRRNWKLQAMVERQCQSLRGRAQFPATGGYGVAAADMQYYEMRNQNLMVGSTIPRLITPQPSHHRSTTPRLSAYRRSMSHSPTLTFPPAPSDPPSPVPFLPRQDGSTKSSMDYLTVNKKKFRYSGDASADDENSS